MSAERLVIVANRLPVRVIRQGDQVRLEPSSGGLATALSSLWSSHPNGLWIGSVDHDPSIDVDDLLAHRYRDEPYDLKAVPLTTQETEKFYAGFANEIIWPLFHDLQSRCNFSPEYWDMYQRVNQKFANAVQESTREGDLVWIHDYHFMLVADYLRQAGVRSKLGFFLHIPFPPPDVFEKLPWRETVLRALLDFDVVGFQTDRDCENFVNCLTRLFPNVETERPASDRVQVKLDGQKALVGAFPISIDFEEFATAAAQPDIAEKSAAIRHELLQDVMVLGVDRLDYTKGIPERLQSFRVLLERHPELIRQIILTQIVVPSRSDIPEYKDLRQEIELLVSQINGQFTQPGWVPIHYMYRSVPRNDLLVYYRAADIALITPLKDGMNLVAKEFCACQVDENGVLILSEFAGASWEMGRGALIVNPNDFVGVAQAIYQACTMLPEEKRSRMRMLRDTVRNRSVQRWAVSFFDAVASIEGQAVASGAGAGESKPLTYMAATPGVAVLGPGSAPGKLPGPPAHLV